MPSQLPKSLKEVKVRTSGYDLLLYVIACIVPFIPVWLKRGFRVDVIINIFLWILGWVPGIIHAWYIIGKYQDTPRQDISYQRWNERPQYLGGTGGQAAANPNGPPPPVPARKVHGLPPKPATFTTST